MSVLEISLSGMQAQTSRLNTIAENIANTHTPGYRPFTTQLESTSAGVRATVLEDAQNVTDPAIEMLNMIDAERGFKANASAFETGADLWTILLAIKRD